MKFFKTVIDLLKVDTLVKLAEDSDWFQYYLVVTDFKVIVR